MSESGRYANNFIQRKRENCIYQRTRQTYRHRRRVGKLYLMTMLELLRMIGILTAFKYSKNVNVYVHTSEKRHLTYSLSNHANSYLIRCRVSVVRFRFRVDFRDNLFSASYAQSK